VECKNKSDTNHNRGNWKHLKITQKISKQLTRVNRELKLGEARVAIFFVTFLTNKEKFDLFLYKGTMKVHAFVETCHQGMYAWSTELRALRTVSL
jgi:hypothetical protein